MKPTLTYLLLLTNIFAGVLWAQTGDYELSRSQAPVPPNVRMNVPQRFELLSKDLDKKGKKSVIREQNEFAIRSAFFIDNLLKSGKVLYNEPMSKYVNSLMDHILKDDPELRSQLHVYVSRDVAYNAFATDHGVIMVNVGLLARARSEAEIVFVLCHEIQHYLKKHGIERVKKRSDLQVDNTSRREEVLRIHAYNRLQEEEADTEGLTLYLKTGYHLRGIKDAMDNMAVTHLHFENIPFSDILMESGTLYIPDQYMLEKVRSIKTYEDEDDENSTHPNLASRRKYLGERITPADSAQQRPLEVINADMFDQAQQMARMEMADLYMQVGYYDFAYYTAYVMGLSFPESNYLQRTKVYSLYTIAMHACFDTVRNVVSNYKKIQGEPQRATFLFQKMSPKELAVVALRENYLYWLESGDSLYLETSKDLMRALGGEKEVSFETFAKEVPSKMPEANAETLLKYGLSDLAVLSGFEEMYKAEAEDFKANKPAKTTDQLTVRQQMAQYKQKELERKKKKNAHIANLKKVLIINPNVLVMDNKIPSGIDLKLSKEAQLLANQKIKEGLAAKGYEVEFLLLDSLNDNDQQVLNDYRTLLDYLKEYANQELLLEPSQKSQLAAFQKRYNTRYIAFFTHEHQIYRQSVGMFLVLTLGSFGLYTPYALYHAAVPYGTYNSTMILYDLETGQRVDRNYLLGKGPSVNGRIAQCVRVHLSMFKQEK